MLLLIIQWEMAVTAALCLRSKRIFKDWCRKILGSGKYLSGCANRCILCTSSIKLTTNTVYLLTWQQNALWSLVHTMHPTQWYHLVNYYYLNSKSYHSELFSLPFILSNSSVKSADFIPVNANEFNAADGHLSTAYNRQYYFFGVLVFVEL